MTDRIRFALLFLVLVAVLLFLLAGHNPLQAALGVGIVALGIPVYLIAFRRRTTPTPLEAVGSDDLDSHRSAHRGG